MSTKKREHAEMLLYFHKERGDMERYCDYEEAMALFPDIAKAKADAEYYERVLDLLLENLLNSLEAEND